MEVTTNPELTTNAEFAVHRDAEGHFGVGVLIRHPTGIKENISGAFVPKKGQSVPAVALRIALRRLVKVGATHVVVRGQEVGKIAERLHTSKDPLLSSLRDIAAKFESLALQEVTQSNKHVQSLAKIALNDTPMQLTRDAPRSEWGSIDEVARQFKLAGNIIRRLLLSHGVDWRNPNQQWFDEGWVIASKGHAKSHYLRWNREKVRGLIKANPLFGQTLSEKDDTGSGASDLDGEIEACASALLAAIDEADRMDEAGNAKRAEELLRMAALKYGALILRPAAAMALDQLPGRLVCYQDWLEMLSERG